MKESVMTSLAWIKSNWVTFDKKTIIVDHDTNLDQFN